MILRTIHCDICGISQMETKENEGWEGWGQINGISINGAINPSVCPDDLSRLADFADELCEELE